MSASYRPLVSPGTGSGANLVLWLSLAVAGSGLQRPPAIATLAWNAAALKATFDGVALDDDRHLLLYYVFKNTTNADYRLEDGSNVVVMMKLRGKHPGWRELSPQDLRVFYPIFVPSRQRQIVVVKYLRGTYGFRPQLKLHASSKEEQAFQARLKAFVRIHSPDFGTLVLFDKTAGYRIDLPWD
jgi:hypothetical protein